MARGGKRAGAGRKPLPLSYLDRLAIGGRVEALLQKSHAEQLRKKALAHYARYELAAKYETLRALRNRDLTDEDTAASEIVADVKDILSKGQRVFTSLRPYGARQRIFEQVAKERTEETGVRISLSFVSDCFKEHRRFQAKLSKPKRTV